MLLGLRFIADAAWAMFSDTVVTCGVFEAPEAKIVMVALWVPADSPAMFALTVTLSVSPVELPEVGESVSQD